MKKKNNKKLLIGSGLGVLLISAASSAIAASNISFAHQTNISTNLQNVKTTNTNNVDLDNNDLINSNNAMSLARYVHPNKKSVGGADGVLAQSTETASATDKHISYFKFKDGGKESWHLSTNDLIDAYHIKDTNVFVILDRPDDSHLRIMSVNGDTGAVINSSNMPKTIGAEYINYSLTQFDNAPEAFMIMPRMWMSQTDRLAKTWYARFERNGTNLKVKQLMTDHWAGNSWVLAVKPVWVSPLKKNIIVTIIVDENKHVWVRVFDEFNKEKSMEFETKIILEDEFINDEALLTHYSGANTLFATYWNKDGNKNRVLIHYILPRYKSKAITVSYDIDGKTMFKVGDGVIDLNAAGSLDIDFNNNMRWVDKKLYARPSWIQLADKQFYQGNLLEFSFPSDDYLKAESFTNGKYVTLNSNLMHNLLDRNVEGVPVSVGEDKIVILKENNMWIINKTVNDLNGGWGYETYVKEGIISLEDFTNELAHTYAQDNGRKLKEVAIQKNYPHSIYGQYQKDSEYELLVDVNNDDFYLGQIKTQTRFTKGYDANGKLTTVTPSEKVIFNGFHQYTTALKVKNYTLTNEPIKNQLPSRITPEALKEFVVNNINSIFVDLPLDFNNDHLSVSDLEPNTKNGTLSFNINLSRWINEAHQLQTTNQSFNLQLSGFTNQTTIVSPTTINVTDTQFTILPNTSDLITDAQLITWLQQEQAANPFIANLPAGYTFDSSNITLSNKDTSTPGQIKLNITLNNVNTPTGSLEGEVIFNGFKVDGLTTNITNTNITTTLNNKKASSITNNDESLKPTILNHLKQYLTGAPTGKNFNNLTTSDFNFNIKSDSVNDSTGSLTIQISLINGYGWKNAVVDNQYLLPHDIVVTGFQTQAATTLKTNASLSAGSFKDLVNSKFTKDNATTLLNEGNNLESLFVENTLPPNTTATITSVQAITDTNTVTVRFTLNQYYNTNGMLENETSSEYEIQVTGFSTKYTSLAKTNIHLNGVNDIYAVNTKTVNESFVKAQLVKAFNADKTIITNVDANMQFNSSNIIIVEDSMRNFWSEQPTNNLGELVIQFKLTGNGVNLPSGQTTSNTFSITLNGFKLTPDTTTLKNNITSLDISGNATLKNINANNVNESHYQTIISEIVNKKIFDNLKPGNALDSVDASHLTINSHKVIDNPNGKLNISFTLNNDKAWVNGKPSAQTFELNLTGFLPYITSPTTLKHDARTVLKDNYHAIFKNESKFIVDIFSKSPSEIKTQYEDPLKTWLNATDTKTKKPNAHKIFDHYAVNGKNTKVIDVKLEAQYPKEKDLNLADNVKISITLENPNKASNNLTNDVEVYNLYSNSQNEKVFFPTPRFEFDDTIKDQIKDMIDNFNEKARMDARSLKDNIADLVLNDFRKIEIVPELYPILVQEMYQEDKKTVKAEVDKSIIITTNEQTNTIDQVEVNLKDSEHRLLQSLQMENIVVKSSVSYFAPIPSNKTWIIWALVSSLVVLVIIVVALIVSYAKKSKSVKIFQDVHE